MNLDKNLERKSCKRIKKKSLSFVELETRYFFYMMVLQHLVVLNPRKPSLYQHSLKRKEALKENMLSMVLMHIFVILDTRSNIMGL